MKLLNKYSKFIEFLFFIFLLLVLSLGRAFSILHINTPWIPLFITEIFIVISIPFLLLNYRDIFKKLPKKFLIFLFIYFCYGCLYLFLGILNRNLFALRDVVLCGYILFLPITLIIFSDLKNFKIFIFILFLSNFFNLLAGRFLILDIYPTDTLYKFISKIKDFNLGLYYGIVITYILSFYNCFKSKVVKISALLLISLNLYMIIIFAKRTLWLALLVLFVYLFLYLKKIFLRIMIYLIPLFLLMSLMLFYIDFGIKVRNQQLELAKGKFVSTVIFLTKNFLLKEVPTSDYPYAVKSSIDNIIWRLIVWKDTLKFGLESPLFGKGFGVYPKYKIWGYHEPYHIGVDSGIIPVHNHILAIFYKMGFLGLGLFLFLNIYVFIYGLNYIKKCNSDFLKCFLIGSLGAFIFWHTLALFFDVIDSPPTSIFLWIIMGLIFSTIQIDRKYAGQPSNN